MVWVHRIFITGRKGSGRKTQAALLAKEFNLVFSQYILPYIILFPVNKLYFHPLVNVDYLILKYIKCNSNIDEILLKIKSHDSDKRNSLIMSIVQKRIMKPDCLINGWVVVGLPVKLLNMDNLKETFVTPPNKYELLFNHFL